MVRVDQVLREVSMKVAPVFDQPQSARLKQFLCQVVRTD